jgi:hypothetical protein
MCISNNENNKVFLYQKLNIFSNDLKLKLFQCSSETISETRQFPKNNMVIFHLNKQLLTFNPLLKQFEDLYNAVERIKQKVSKMQLNKKVFTVM